MNHIKVNTMAPPKFVFCLSCVLLWKMAPGTDLNLSSSDHQASGFLSGEVGGKLILQCFYEAEASAWLYWYKKTAGQKLNLISSFYVFHTSGTFKEEFRNNPRFTLETGNGKNHLKISDLQFTDSATYYCIHRITIDLEFIEDITVSVNGSGLSIKALVHQSASESIQPGGSVTLSCTVHTGTCDGGHSVYWFRNQDDEESQPGLIYTHGGRSDQCERKPDTQTHTCVYNLPMKSLNPSHAGTYYCAVVSCGHILFGNGTKLDFQGEVNTLVLLYVLIGSVAINIILLVLLGCGASIWYKTRSGKCTDHQERCSAASGPNAEGNQDADNLHYAALSENKFTRSRRQQDDTWTECVYSSVRQ